MTSVLDASALLAYLRGEGGADRIESLLLAGAKCSSVSWSEVAQKVHAAGGDWPVASALLQSYGLHVEPATADHAERAASLWRRGSGLSLADRFCLALGDRTGTPVWTADSAWGESDAVHQIR